MITQTAVVKFNAEFTNTINPVINFNAKGELKNENDKVESSLQLIHGPDLSSKTNILKASYKAENTWKGPGEYLYALETKLDYPLVGLDFEYELKISPKTFEYDIEVQYSDVKFGSELELALNKKQSGDFEVEFGIYGLDNKVHVKAERVVQGDVSTVSNELEVNGKKLKVNGKIRHQLKSGNVDVGADLTVVLPTHPTPFKVNSGLKYNPNDYDAHHKVTSGSTVIVDAFIKGNKQGNANGSFKVNIKNYLVVNGHIKATKGTGTADLLIDAQKVKQQLKLDSTFKIQPPSVYDLDITIYPSFNKDKTQQIKFASNNKIEPESINSRSQLDLLGKKLELNVKGTKSGNEHNGKLNGEIEATLPNDLYILGKLYHNREFKNDLYNGEGLASIEYRKNKNAPGRKMSIKSNYQNTNPQQGLYDLTYVVSADDSNGHNINGDLYYKRLKQGERKIVELGNKIYGSLIKNTIAGNLKASYDNHVGKVDITSSYGTDSNMKVGGSYSLAAEGKPHTGDIHLKISTPNKNLNLLDLAFTGSILRPQHPSKLLEIKGSGKIFAESKEVNLVHK